MNKNITQDPSQMPAISSLSGKLAAQQINKFLLPLEKNDENQTSVASIYCRQVSDIKQTWYSHRKREFYVFQHSKNVESPEFSILNRLMDMESSTAKSPTYNDGWDRLNILLRSYVSWSLLDTRTVTLDTLEQKGSPESWAKTFRITFESTHYGNIVTDTLYHLSMYVIGFILLSVFIRPWEYAHQLGIFH